MRKTKYKTLSLPPQEIDRLREIAEQERRSMAQQVIHWMEQHISKKLQEESA